MSNAHADPMLAVADALSGMMWCIGVAFIEDDHLRSFADALTAYLEAAGIETDLGRAVEYFADRDDAAKP